MRTSARLRLIAVFVAIAAGLVAAQLFVRSQTPRDAVAQRETGAQRETAQPREKAVTWEDLTASPVRLPTWPDGTHCASDAVQLQEPTGQSRPGSVVLVATDKGDVTGDGANEMIAIVHCVGKTTNTMQAVAFTRDEAGAIVPLGQVTCDERRMLLGVEVQPNGSVQVDAVSADGHEEWLTFRWSGDYFKPVV